MSRNFVRSNAQKNASRSNGAQSQGPSSPEGKARSSQNALKHGIYSNRVVLANENPREYQQMLDAYIAEWRPVGQTEADLLLQMVNARWRMDRCTNQARALENSNMYRQFEQFTETFEPTDAAMRQANATFAEGKSAIATLDFLYRSERRFDVLYHSARKQLREQQKMRTGVEPKLDPQPALPLPGQSPTGNEPRIIGDHCTNPEEFDEFSIVYDLKQMPREVTVRWVDNEEDPPSDLAA